MKSLQSFLLKPALVLLLIFLQFSCKKSEIKKEKVNSMVLVYMEANNDLRYDALNSINRMEKGAQALDGILLVYIKTSSVRSYLLKIKFDEDENRIVSDTIKVFENNSTSDPEFFKDVINYAQTEFPANNYGLVLWSHATSWAPANTGISTKSFGRDTGKEFDIIELKNAVPDNLQFIIFDACSMGGVEVLYEFKDKAKYIIASPTETIAESFPYQSITPMLFKGTEGLSNIARAYYEYYNSYTDDRQSATVVLIKTSELPALAQEMKSLMAMQKVYGDKLISTNVQRLDFTTNFPVATYDFGDFLDHNFSYATLNNIHAQMDKLMLYKASTNKFLGVPINKFSGLTCYIPFQNDVNLNYYKRLQWYRASGFNIPIEQQ
ncbi:clostripain-related cysteine peptidase [Pedobacter sp. MC2016-15]|uniref:clostripain-related cysteine peptidase n=1 Tax=Pedobacter sp. MC2016-15 TaxID=2994473 RepID=UPI0022466B20|nr:clostripain-related cysteine peptidase [Pedobacter sp. MC2016-15]MCX2481141.1 clostripain-related cysteine peptidase [Pedobacter sp. MC2016-15]